MTQNNNNNNNPASGTDPKAIAGAIKCQMHLLPPAALRATADALSQGAEKYGPWNWRNTNVNASVYVGAMLRHLTAWWDGELTDPDSGFSHLAHVAASAFIMLDAEDHGTLCFDTPGQSLKSTDTEDHEVHLKSQLAAWIREAELWRDIALGRAEEADQPLCDAKQPQ